MNWEKEAINDLKTYRARKGSIENVKEKIKALELQARDPKGCSITSSGGGAASHEDVLINNIAERGRLTLLVTTTEMLIGAIENGLKQCTEQQRRILEIAFINHTPNYIDVLSKEFGYEKTKIYELRRKAIRQFTIALYGITDL